MIPIYIFGNDEDETLGQIIKKAISPFGTTVYNTDKHSDEINDTCSFFMKEQEDCSNLKNSVGIAVFKKSFLPKEPVILPANWIAVIDSNHDKLKEQFCKTGQIVVTCGTKATDTFSISSLDENQASISLQRTLIAINGTFIEPCEITMHITKPYHPNKILPVAAVLLLAGIQWDAISISEISKNFLYNKNDYAHNSKANANKKV